MAVPVLRRRVLSWVRWRVRAAVRQRDARYAWAQAHSLSRVRINRSRPPLSLRAVRSGEAMGPAMLVDDRRELTAAVAAVVAGFGGGQTATRLPRRRTGMPSAVR